MATPVTRYAKSGDVHIAYQVFGSGPIDLVSIPGFVSHIEHYWEHPDFAAVPASGQLRPGGDVRQARNRPGARLLELPGDDHLFFIHEHTAGRTG